MRNIIAVVLILSASVVQSADFQKGLDSYNKGDFKIAYNEWNQLAEQGDPRAQYNLGFMYTNGEGVLLVKASGIAALSGSPPSVLAVKCSGMGIVDSESKAKTDFYCSFIESEKDGFDVKGIVEEDTGAFDVVGDG